MRKFNRKLSLSIDELHQRLDELDRQPKTFPNKRRRETLKKLLAKLSKRIPV